MFVLFKQYFHFKQQSHWREHGFKFSSFRLFNTIEDTLEYLKKQKAFQNVNSSCVDEWFVSINDFCWDDVDIDDFHESYNHETETFIWWISEKDCIKYVIKKMIVGQEMWISNTEGDPENVGVEMKVEINKIISNEQYVFRKGYEMEDLYRHWMFNKKQYPCVMIKDGKEVDYLEIALFIVESNTEEYVDSCFIIEYLKVALGITQYMFKADILNKCTKQIKSKKMSVLFNEETVEDVIERNIDNMN